MRYRVVNLGGRRRPSLGENMRVDLLWVRYGFVAPPPANSPISGQWRTCNDLVGSLAPGYEPDTPQGQAAMSCMNQMLTTLGRESEIVPYEPPVPAPGDCTTAGVPVNQAPANYAPLSCPTGVNCHSVIDANTGLVIVRDAIGPASPNATCGRWGFNYGAPAGGWPQDGGTGGTGSGTGGTGGTGGAGGAPGSGGIIYQPVNVPYGGYPGQYPGGQGQPQSSSGAQGAQTEIIPEKKAVDKSGLVGAGLGILAVVGAAIYGSQK